MKVTRRAILASGAGSLAVGCLDGGRTRSTASCPGTVSEGVDVRLGFVGDVMLGRGVDERWSDATDPGGVWGSTAARLRDLDGLFLNLECCLSTRGEQWPGKTYYFRADPNWAVPALEAAGTTFASLANNHTLDFGTTALTDTRSHLDEADVAHAGAGPDAETAFAPVTVDVGDLRVAVLALTDQFGEYSAGQDSPGTAHLTLDSGNERLRDVVDAALATATDEQADLVVASLHWGPNWETSPAKQQREFARFLVDRGIDVVHGHSAHVVQGVETYRGHPIMYDTGDFVDDYVHREDVRNKRSFVFELVVADGRLDHLRLVPVRIRDEHVDVADDETGAWLRETMRARSGAVDTTVERAGSGLRIPLSC
jgi:poly-gamma-glutamate synthesis protein (capsule biosynthesis protein)